MIPQIRKCLMSESHLIVQKKPTHRNPLSYSIAALFFSSLQTSKDPKAHPTAEYLTIHHKFSPKTASRASSFIPFLKNPQNSDSVLAYLSESGFTKARLEKLISNFPQVLSIKLKTIEPKIKVFLDSGFSSSDIADIVSNCPWTLKNVSDSQLAPKIALLKSILGSNDAVFKALKRSGYILLCDLEKTMIPNIKYLKSRGISSSQITTYLGRFPRFFFLKPESLVEIVRRVEEMGFDMNSRMLIEAIWVVSRMTPEKWELKLDVFRRLGYSEDEILRVFRRWPQVFRLSEQKIKRAVRVFVTEGEVDIAYLVERFGLLTYSIDGRVKPRLQVMEILKKKDLLRKRPQLSTMMAMSRNNFFDKFVHPYSKVLGDDVVASLQS